MAVCVRVCSPELLYGNRYIVCISVQTYTQMHTYILRMYALCMYVSICVCLHVCICVCFYVLMYAACTVLFYKLFLSLSNLQGSMEGRTKTNPQSQNKIKKTSLIRQEEGLYAYRERHSSCRRRSYWTECFDITTVTDTSNFRHPCLKIIGQINIKQF